MLVRKDIFFVNFPLGMHVYIYGSIMIFITISVLFHSNFKDRRECETDGICVQGQVCDLLQKGKMQRGNALV